MNTQQKLIFPEFSEQSFKDKLLYRSTNAKIKNK